MPFLIGMMVDDAHDAPYALFAVIGHERLHLRKLQPGIGLDIEELTDVALQIGDILWAVIVDAMNDAYEIVHRAMRVDGNNADISAHGE